MITTLRSALFLIALLGLVSCARANGGPVLAQSVQSDKERVLSPHVDDAELAELVNGNQAFALDLYRFLKDGSSGKASGNLFYSPHSISLALAMTYAGAHGETEREMAKTLHFTLPQDHLHSAFNRLDLELAQRGQGAEGKDEGGFRLHIVNAIWGQQGTQFLDDFLDTLAENYGAGLRLLDFRRDPETARVTINDWISEQTEGKIEDLIPPGAIDTLTRLVLTNAIYFNAAWAESFDKDMTTDGPFYRLDGSQVTVPMMKQQTSFRYAEGEGYQAVELPYDGWELSMVILLPDAQGFQAFEDTLDAETLTAILQDLSRHKVVLTMPRFEMTSDFSLAQVLTAMGMPAAFSDSADFSGMTGGRDLFIGDVIHKAFVSVDEEGTEAAAATAVIMEAMAVMPEPERPIEVTVDHPFIFLIRDIQTGTILFLGRVVDPSQ